MHHSGVAAFDLEHLRELELREPRVRQVERDGDAGHAVGREPLVRQPEVRAERRGRAPSSSPLSCVDARLELGALDLQVQFPELQVQQLVVGERPQGVGTELAVRGAGTTRMINQLRRRAAPAASATAAGAERARGR